MSCKSSPYTTPVNHCPCIPVLFLSVFCLMATLMSLLLCPANDFKELQRSSDLIRLNREMPHPVDIVRPSRNYQNARVLENLTKVVASVRSVRSQRSRRQANGSSVSQSASVSSSASDMTSPAASSSSDMMSSSAVGGGMMRGISRIVPGTAARAQQMDELLLTRRESLQSDGRKHSHVSSGASLFLFQSTFLFSLLTCHFLIRV